MNTLTDAQRWQAVLDRDARYDGRFVFGVRTTGIYCKPSCPARHPRPENVVFFTAPKQAEIAGYRACKRCRPNTLGLREPNLELIQRVCRALEARPDDPPTLADLAKQFHLSPYHLQRTFKRLVGVTPKQYTLALRAQRLKDELRDSDTVTTAAFNAGFNGLSRLYEQPALGMTPDRYRRGGAALEIGYAVVESPLGWLLVAATAQGICSVKLGDSPRALEAELRNEFAAATLQSDPPNLRRWVGEIVDYLRGEQPHLDLPTDVRATAFQRRVWEELRRIPPGETRSYSAVAEALGKPKAARAVARACALNPTALVVPCHRVVGEDGQLRGYRWGLERKRRLLEQEKRMRER
jgi:AraC family transcriptional regulator of adaptative response/methylated-DNA-[protein]-cysteine methyltransferase